MEVINWILGLGASVMMPIIFTIIGTCVGLGFVKSLKSGLTVGVAFVGLSIVTTLLTDNLGPVINTIVELYGLNLNVLDIGWPAASQIAYSSQVGALVIPFGLALNIVMLLTKTTKTIAMDLFNYWHYAFIGALVYIATNSFGWSLFIVAVNFIIVNCIGDIESKRVLAYYGHDKVNGIAFPVPVCVPYAPIAHALNWLMEKCPGINKIDWDAKKLQEKLGFIGEPLFLGTVIGAILGILARYDVTAILKLAVNIGAVMLLIPRISGLFGEGLLPITEAVKKLLQRRFKGKVEFLIGLSPSLVVGDATNMVCSVLVVPFILFLSVVLPGNQFLPIASLAGAMYIFPLVLPITKGNVFRTFVIGMVALIIGDYSATALASMFTKAAVASGVTLPAGTDLVASFDYAGNPLAWILYNLGALKWIGAAVCSVACAALMWCNRRKIVAETALSAEALAAKAAN